MKKTDAGLDAPVVTPWSDVRMRRDGMAEAVRRPQDYVSFREYFDDQIAPTLRRATPDVQIGYPSLKRRG